MRFSSSAAYEYVQKIISYAISTIKEFLANNEKYDIKNW